MDLNPKIRVCHIASGDLWAGAEVQIYNLVCALHENQRIEVSVILLNAFQLAEKLQKAGIEVKVVDERTHAFPAIVREAGQWLQSRPMDILHSHRFKENVLASILKRRQRARYLVQTVHGLGEPERGIRKLKTAMTTLLTGLYTRPQVDRVIAVSQDIAQNLIPTWGTERVTVIRNSVALPEQNVSGERDRVRREFGLNPDQPLIGTAGRLMPVKGYDQFLKAARLIADKVPTAKFLIAGDGPLKGELERCAKELGVSDRVIFTGFRNDIQALLAALDLFVMSSLHEGIPVVLLEAMALSRPVVVTAVGGMVEVVEADTSGILVPAQNSEVLAEACLRLLGNSALRQQLGAQGLARVKAEFTIENQCRRTIDLYQQLVGIV